MDYTIYEWKQVFVPYFFKLSIQQEPYLAVHIRASSYQIGRASGVMQTSVYYHPLSFAETDQIYTTLLHVQKNGIKYCVLIKTLLSFS